MKKQILTAALLSLLSAGLTAAELTVAATPVPHGDILRLVAPDLKAQGYDLKVVEFSDFVSPNIALDAKEVTAGYECGVTLSKFSDIKEGDIFESYEIEEYRE